MIDFGFVVLYVEDIAKSKAFYTGLLGRGPRELSPSFVSYDLDSGLKLELWERDKVRPAPTGTGGGCELCMVLPDAASVNSLYEEWKGKGVIFALEPFRAVFGLTFVALDPDGHRLRVNAGS
jgi:catechol 2,3-dioxygenase-like lactoylglutathione lyase family enzyme